MAARTTHTLGVDVPDAALRRVSAPHIPLMVVVTDVDGEKPGNTETSMQMSPENSPHPNLYPRASKGILKSESSDHSLKNSSSSTSVGSASSSKKVSVALDVVKPITKWRRICKCFIGLKMTKKNKPNASPSQKGQPGGSGGENKTSYSVPIARRNRSQSLHPGGDPNMLSVSPARSMQSIRSRLSARSETDFYLFDMGNMSEILTITDIKQIGKSFPASAVGCPCILTFSTSMDGYSLHTLYRKMEKIDSPMILAILDSEGRAFGAVLSCALRVSEHFYGSCDSFLFRCGPPLEVFKWQPDGNFYFIHSEESFLRVGAGKGNCGIWLDDNLYHGRTEECATFGSPPLVPELDFEVAAVEVWTFGQI